MIELRSWLLFNHSHVWIIVIIFPSTWSTSTLPNSISQCSASPCRCCWFNDYCSAAVDCPHSTRTTGACSMSSSFSLLRTMTMLLKIQPCLRNLTSSRICLKVDRIFAMHRVIKRRSKFKFIVWVGKTMNKGLEFPPLASKCSQVLMMVLLGTRSPK